MWNTENQPRNTHWENTGDMKIILLTVLKKEINWPKPAFFIACIVWNKFYATNTPFFVTLICK